MCMLFTLYSSIQSSVIVAQSCLNIAVVTLIPVSVLVTLAGRDLSATDLVQLVSMATSVSKCVNVATLPIVTMSTAAVSAHRDMPGKSKYLARNCIFFSMSVNGDR